MTKRLSLNTSNTFSCLLNLHLFQSHFIVQLLLSAQRSIPFHECAAAADVCSNCSCIIFASSTSTIFNHVKALISSHLHHQPFCLTLTSFLSCLLLAPADVIINFSNHMGQCHLHCHICIMKLFMEANNLIHPSCHIMV